MLLLPCPKTIPSPYRSFLTSSVTITKSRWTTKGGFHKGCINYSPEFVFQYSVRRNACSRNIYFTVPVPDFKQNWRTLIGDDLLFTGRSTVSSFLKLVTTSTNTPSINYFSDKNIFSPCPPSQFKSLDHSNTYRQVWIDLYVGHEVHDKISISQYLALKRSGKILKAIPSMCVLFEMINSH